MIIGWVASKCQRENFGKVGNVGILALERVCKNSIGVLHSLRESLMNTLTVEPKAGNL